MSWVMLLSKKRDGEGDGDVFMSSKMMKFQNIEDERVSIWWVMGVLCCVERVVAWSSLYRAKYVTKFELVEGKISK